MQLQLISIVLVLHWMEHANCQHHTSRHRLHERGPGCLGGCLTCSASNGCLTCMPRLFIHLERDGMRQFGVCLASCPKGFFGTRSPEKNDCSKCGSECDTCFDKNFCTRCKAGSYLHKGKCQEKCPDDLVPSDIKRECVASCPVNCESCLNSDTCTRCMSGHYLLHGQCHSICPEEFEPSEQSMECIPKVHCELGEWSEWGPCLRKGKSCFGEESRTRQVLQSPSPQGNSCSSAVEKRECIIKKKRCGKGDKGTRKGERKNRNNRKEKTNNEGRRERKRERERERDPGTREDDSRNKTEQRHKRTESRDTVME